MSANKYRKIALNILSVVGIEENDINPEALFRFISILRLDKLTWTYRLILGVVMRSVGEYITAKQEVAEEQGT